MLHTVLVVSIELRFAPTFVHIPWISAFALIATGVVIWVSVRHGSDHRATVDRILTVWLVAALVVVAYLTLQPGPNGLVGARPSIFNPMSRLDREDAIANVLLYIPVGLFAALLWRSKTWIVVRATGFVFAVSFTIEFAQRALPLDRAATTHDVVFNTLGGLAGAVVGALVARAAR